MEPVVKDWRINLVVCFFNYLDVSSFQKKCLTHYWEYESSFSNVIEFRDVSWWQKKVFKKLATHNIQFCGISFPGLDDKVIHNTSLVYYRFHGVPRLYKSCYKKDFVVEYR